MARNAAYNVAFLPIKPQFAQAIVSGKKWVEFRKTRFKRDVQYVVIYSSSPEKIVLGYFSVKEIEVRTPNQTWKRYSKGGCIKKQDYLDYYDGARQAVAILVECVHRLTRPETLASLGLEISVPQSYAYLSRTDFKRISRKPKSEIQPVTDKR